jgi:hypothetical protein
MPGRLTTASQSPAGLVPGDNAGGPGRETLHRLGRAARLRGAFADLAGLGDDLDQIPGADAENVAQRRQRVVFSRSGVRVTRR